MNRRRCCRRLRAFRLRQLERAWLFGDAVGNILPWMTLYTLQQTTDTHNRQGATNEAHDERWGRVSQRTGARGCGSEELWVVGL
jgi:hypothetical protein